LKSTSSSDSLPFGKAFRRAGHKGRAALVISSWFGVGLLPGMPGTAGTVAALPAVILVHAAGPLTGLVVILLFAAVAVQAAGVTEKVLGRPDPKEVVSDEVAGFMVTMFLLPLTLPYLMGGFILFRVLDILKPFPIRRLENLPGGAGVVLDDLAAGVMANLILRGAGALQAVI